MTLGLVTVGQSPRSDVTSDLGDVLRDVRLVEHGALDGVGEDELRRLTAAAEVADTTAGDGLHVLASRLADGRGIVYRERDAVPRTRDAVRRCVEDGASAVLLACTGAFPPLDAPVPVLYPDRILQQVVLAVHGGGPVTVVTPDPAQVEDQRRRWGRLLAPGAPPDLQVANPYTPDWRPRFERLGRHLADAPPALVVLDCIGYSSEMAERLRGHLPTGRPILLARQVAARVAVAVLDRQAS